MLEDLNDWNDMLRNELEKKSKKGELKKQNKKDELKKQNKKDELKEKNNNNGGKLTEEKIEHNFSFPFNLKNDNLKSKTTMTTNLNDMENIKLPCEDLKCDDFVSITEYLAIAEFEEMLKILTKQHNKRQMD